METNTTQNVPATTDSIVGTSAAQLANGRTVGRTPKAKPEAKASSVYEMLTESMPSPVPSPKGSWDAVESFARAKGFPCSFRQYRDAVLSRVGTLTGKCRWTSGGTSTSAKLALDAAFAEVCKHVKATAKDKDVADQAATARRQFKTVLAILTALGGEAEVELSVK